MPVVFYYNTVEIAFQHFQPLAFFIVSFRTTPRHNSMRNTVWPTIDLRLFLTETGGGGAGGIVSLLLLPALQNISQIILLFLMWQKLAFIPSTDYISNLC